MKKYILLIVVSLSFAACKKKSTIHISAKNAVTGQPYPGLKYSIVRSKTGLFESHYKTVASGTLNENGEAYITKRFSKNWSHSITLQRPDNYCYANKLHYYFSGGENVEANFEYAECGYLKIISHNINCQGATDTMRYRYKYPYSDWEWWSLGAFGCQDYSSDYVRAAQGKRIFEWEVIRNNTTNYYYDTIFIESNKYYTFTINY